MIFLAPFGVGRHSVSQAPHSILAYRNGETIYHKAIAELPVHHYDAGVTANNLHRLLVKQSSPYLVLGGDHSITLGILRARYEQDGPVHLVMFDAHSDDYTMEEADSVHPLNAGNWLRFALEEELLSGITWYNYRGMTLQHKPIPIKSSKTNVHITVDLDVLTPSEYGWAAQFPEPGGCTLSRLESDIRNVGGVKLGSGAKVTADLVEYDPTKDATKAGAWACSRIVDALKSVIDA